MSGASRFASATKSKSTLEVAFPKSELSVPFPVYKLVNGRKRLKRLSLTEEESFVERVPLSFQVAAGFEEFGNSHNSLFA